LFKPYTKDSMIWLWWWGWLWKTYDL